MLFSLVTGVLHFGEYLEDRGLPVGKIEFQVGIHQLQDGIAFFHNGTIFHIQ